MKKTIRDINLKEKRVLVRVDFNVPLKDGKITDTTRITEALPTIKYCLDNNAKVILLSHLGRVKTEEDLAKNDLSIVALKLSELLNQDVNFINATSGEEVKDAVEDLKCGEILMLQNTRYEDLDGKKESGNNQELAEFWSSLCDVFVNDAFGTAHRAHASNVGIATYKKDASVSGFLLEKEIKYLSEAVDNPKRPFVAILGGAKVSDKIKVINNLLDKADKILIGGAMAYTFLKAQGIQIGKSKCEDECLDIAKELLNKGQDKIILPIDHIVVKELKEDACDGENVTEFSEDVLGIDCGENTLKEFKEVLNDAKTVVWNGPLGVFEYPCGEKGTKELCSILADITIANNATTIIGGGDSASAVNKFGYKDKMTHISTGGGASLEYLEGNGLPGIDILTDK